MVRLVTKWRLALVVVVMLLLGVVSIAVPGALLTTAGVLLVIVGLMGLLPIVRLGLADSPAEVVPTR